MCCDGSGAATNYAMKPPVVSVTRLACAKRAPVLALTAVFFSMSCTVVLTERQFFFPERFAVIPDDVHRENVEIRVADDTSLRGWSLTGGHDAKRPSLIYFYGGAQTVMEAAVELHALVKNLEVNVLAVDYRGYGFSDGTPTFEALSDDSLAIYDYLVSRTKSEPAAIFVGGRSMGTVPALKVAASRPIAGVFLVSSFTNKEEVVLYWHTQLPWYKRAFVRLRPDEADQPWTQPVELVRTLNVPVLVIHGTEDKTFPLSMGRRMFDQTRGARKHWCQVEGRGHEDLPITKGPALESIREFIALYRHAS